jgi:hypothetical protein
LSLGKKQKFFTDAEVEFFNDAFSEVNEYKGNTYSLFIQKSLEVLRKEGLFSFIIPNTLLLGDTFKKLRKFILEKAVIVSLLNLKYKVFGEAEIGGNLIFVLGRNRKRGKIKVEEIQDISAFSVLPFNEVDLSVYESNDTHKFFTDVENLKLINKIERGTVKLEKIADFYNGIKTGDNKKFISDSKKDNRFREVIRGRDIERYFLGFNNIFVLFDKKMLWSNTDEEKLTTKPKIIIRQTGDHLTATLDNIGYLTMDTTHLIFNTKLNIYLILAILNSKLMNWYYNKMVSEEGKAFAEVKIVNLKKLPIIKIETSESKKALDEVIKLVEEMLKLNKTSESREKNRTKIEAVDYEIDQLVYKLYGLGEGEVNIIEGK